VIRVAVTPRSMRDTSGPHHELLESADIEVRWTNKDRQLSEEEMIRLVRNCPGLIVGVDPVTEAVFSAGPLRAVVKYGSGMDNIDTHAAERMGVRVASTPAANARSVAELTIALLFALARHIVEHDRDVRAGSWSRRTGIEVVGKKLGVVGLGAVGKEVASLARAIGLDVVAHDPFVETADVQLVPFDDLLASCDAISLHVPLNDSTSGMIGLHELVSMKKGAFLINTARGGIVDEGALADALASGQLGGAALDAFGHEPPGPTRLLEYDNFLASPHAGAATVEAVQRTGTAAITELLRLLEPSQQQATRDGAPARRNSKEG
jgi:D-3-phosphoglycerate dehydrogenase / 2-oxoglutarate reductase